MNAPGLRLFVALWPDEGARDSIARWMSGWHWPASARPVAPERLHLTLHFLGVVPRTGLHRIEQALSLPMSAGCVELDTVQCWGDGLLVLVAGSPDGVSPEILRLQAALAEALAGEGLRMSARPWRPHLTLARTARGAQAPSSPYSVRWRADRYALVLSDGRYQTLRSYPLIG